MKDIIEKMVKEEIRDIVAKQRPAIEEAVSALLIPELKMAIRESVYDALGALTKKPSVEMTESPPMEKEGEVNENGGGDLSKPDAPSSRGQLCDEENGPLALGVYVYCVADSSEHGELGNIGIDQNRVYSIPSGNLCAVVHNCPASPYASEDPAIVKGWVVAHQRVVDAAWERYKTVIPMGFDTIIRGDMDDDPEKSLQKWLQDDYENLMGKIEKVRGKGEFVVQVFWNKKAVADQAAKESREIKELSNEIGSKPRGLAYMYRQKLESLLRKEIENRVDQCFREFYDKIAPHVDDIRVEKTRKTEDPEQQMLLNLSCLLSKEGSQGLGDELEKIDAMDGFSVRYTGPWPPYSFV